MNFSAIKSKIMAYCGCKGGEDKFTDSLARECVAELEKIIDFRNICKAYDSVPDWLRKPPYENFLRGARGVILSVTTLGIAVDKHIKLLSLTDPAKAVVCDAAASAMLELLSDEYEATLGNDLSYRFCPGYGGSSVADIRHIFAAVRPERIGVTMDEWYYMLPSKSMAGIIGVGTCAQKTCDGCPLGGDCRFVREGIRCYSTK